MQLAIADVVWADGMFYSYQPDLERPDEKGVYRMMDEQGQIRFIAPSEMRPATREELMSYWKNLPEREDNDELL